MKDESGENQADIPAEPEGDEQQMMGMDGEQMEGQMPPPDQQEMDQ